MTIRYAGCYVGAMLLCGIAAPAIAQDAPKPLTISGSVALTSDYRLRGVSQTNNGFAVQGGITATHKSGFYGGFWASNLAGWGTFGGPNLELDVIGGYKRSFGPATVDVGLTWYMYPGGADKTDYGEPYVKVSGTLGPASLLAGVAYAPKQQALGNWYFTGADYVAGVPNHPGAKHDNTYLWGDGSAGIPGTKATVKAHIGHSWGNPGLGPNGTSPTPTGHYWDWMAGVDYAIYGPITIGVAYVDTDLTRRKFAYLLPNFADQSSGSGNGKTIAGATGVFTISAAF